jgi:hypothetical protein
MKLKKVAHFSKIYYNTKCQASISDGANLSHTCNVHMTTMLVLLMVWVCRYEGGGGQQQHNIHTNVHEN